MEKEIWKKSLDKIESLPLEDKINRSLKIIKQITSKKDRDIPLIINYSGGKDSTAVLLLAKKVTDNVECCYVDGGLDLPQTISHVKDQCLRFGVKLHLLKAEEIKIGHKKDSPIKNCQTFSDYVIHYRYFPTSAKRWCSCRLKQRVMKAYWRSIYNHKTVLYKLVGVRMFESQVRKWKYGSPKYIEKFSLDGSYFLRKDLEHRPAVLVYPIIEWTKDNVEEFLRQENAEIHEGYKLFGISGCKWCPVQKKEIYKKILTIYPNIYDDIIFLENVIGKPSVEDGKYWLRDIKKEVLNFRLASNKKVVTKENALPV